MRRGLAAVERWPQLALATGVTVTWLTPVRRTTVHSVSRPMRSASSMRTRSSTPVTGRPSIAAMMSPSFRPALAAGPSFSTLRSRTAVLVDTCDRQGGAARQVGGVGRNADEGAAHAAEADDLRNDEIGGVGGDREGDALRAVDHGGVDADDLAGRRHQRAAGIAGVERGVGLDDVVDQPAGRGAHRAAERRDDAGGDGPFEAERIADGNGDLAAPQPLGIAERRDIGKAAVGAHQRDVGVGIAAEHAALAGGAVGHRDAHRLGVADDMEVGDDQPVRRDDEAGAMAALAANALDAADGGPMRSTASATVVE